MAWGRRHTSIIEGGLLRGDVTGSAGGLVRHLGALLGVKELLRRHSGQLSKDLLPRSLHLRAPLGSSVLADLYWGSPGPALLCFARCWVQRKGRLPQNTFYSDYVG